MSAYLDRERRRKAVAEIHFEVLLFGGLRGVEERYEAESEQRGRDATYHRRIEAGLLKLDLQRRVERNVARRLGLHDAGSRYDREQEVFLQGQREASLHGLTRHVKRVRDLALRQALR
jgi:hypothetical protein